MIAIAAGVYIYRKKQNTAAHNMIPQIIHTRDGSIECITLDSLQVAVGYRTTVAVDKSCASISTADETLSINSNDADHDDEEEEEEEEEGAVLPGRGGRVRWSVPDMVRGGRMAGTANVLC